MRHVLAFGCRGDVASFAMASRAWWHALVPAGTGFVTFHLPPPLNIVSLAICMDLNVQPPAVWNSLRGPYEVAEYCIAQKTNLLVLLNAWLDSQGNPRDDTDWQTINFWATRLRPLWAEVVREDAHADANAEDEADSDAEAEDEAEDGADRHTSRAEEGRQPGEELVVVVCNRCGVENGACIPLLGAQRGTVGLTEVTGDRTQGSRSQARLLSSASRGALGGRSFCTVWGGGRRALRCGRTRARTCRTALRHRELL